MKAQELRISNVIDFEGRNAIVKEIDSVGVKVVFDDGEEIWIDLFQFQPIPLTEDWLIKFNWNGYNPMCFNHNFKIDEQGRLYCNSDYKGVNVNYVHQLQNIYFALTGKELTIKE